MVRHEKLTKTKVEKIDENKSRNEKLTIYDLEGSKSESGVEL